MKALDKFKHFMSEQPFMRANTIALIVVVGLTALISIYLLPSP
ncbi:hypothetical protein SAMN05192539_1001331 [Paraburkholderia diazotrophica]|uniref:Uncharacterized protein n=1 Tax=Paraburkholderia diazotrophica TaxID=667676 RepID=A0A1H6QGG1_9BURK|nr:hypothetical protein SAMN05192539_1001331 [Paraburkholderia diazotrophica]